MKEVQTILYKTFYHSANQFWILALLRSWCGNEYFCSYGPFGSNLFWGNVYPEAGSTFNQLKKTGMSRSEYSHIKSHITSAKMKIKPLNGLYGQVRSIQAFRQLHEMNSLSRGFLVLFVQILKNFTM